MAVPCPTVERNGDLFGLLRRYYASPVIRRRMCEFLGGTDLEHCTANYIAGTDGYSAYHLLSPPSELPEYLDGALEVDRSLWDRQSLIADIDLEHHNFDAPAAPWLEPERAFPLEQPVLDASLKILGTTGLRPSVLVSGRGFHLVWAVRRDSAAFRRLSTLGHLSASLRDRYAQPCAPTGSRVDLELGRAFSGLGMVLEYVGHLVLRASADTCPIPVQPAAVEVGPGIQGREIVSFDLSEYGDPLHTRHIRLPFSAYLKPRQFEWALGKAGIMRLLPMFEIPLSGVSPSQAITAMHDPDAVVEIAQQTSAAIPDCSEAMSVLVHEYERSELAAFHRRFHCEDQPGQQSGGPLPPCAQFLLEYPNDWLLKPGAIQHLVRVLMALGWAPASIAQRICASYSCECHWGDTWDRLEPCNRASFYTRLFAGMIVTGADQLVDFNCVSHQEKGYCVFPECSFNLIPYRDMLLEKRRRA